MGVAEPGVWSLTPTVLNRKGFLAGSGHHEELGHHKEASGFVEGGKPNISWNKQRLSHDDDTHLSVPASLLCPHGLQGLFPPHLPSFSSTALTFT